MLPSVLTRLQNPRFTVSRGKNIVWHHLISSRKGLEDGASSGGFRSKVVVQHMEPGPQPDTAAFIQRMEQEKIAKERGETKDNRSFFAKYWMYIIPVVLVLAMSGGNPEGGAGGGR